MKKEYVKRRSQILGREIEYNLYGDRGRPMIAFPTRGGTFYQYEDSGMIEAVRPLIEQGKIQLLTPEGFAEEAGEAPDEKIRRYARYIEFIARDVIADLRARNGSGQKVLASGCGLGAFHAANIGLKFPDVCDALICQSGYYHASCLVGGHMDETTYLHSPLAFLPNLTDPAALDAFMRARMVFSVGRGAHEHDPMMETLALQEIFNRKGLPAFFDLWGPDVSHDWSWWRKQLPYFLEKVL